MSEKNNKKVIRSWAIFDWANSAYALVISTAVFPVYFINSSPKMIDIFGMSFSNSALYSFSVSFSYIIIAALSPLLSGMADISGRRMFFLKIFTLLGAINCSLLYFFKGEPQLWLGTSAFILATIGFAGSLVFYDSYLPIIASEDQYDRVSAKGYTYGYIGSVILLVFILVMIQRPHWFGIIDEKVPARVGFLLVGVWWIGFAQYTFKHMPKDSLNKISIKWLSRGYDEIKKVFFKAMSNKDITNYLKGFFLYSAGVQTVIYLATIFAKEELGMETGELILIVLIIQIIGIVGALLSSRLSARIGNKKALLVQIITWVFICILAYFTHSKPIFYITAAMVGMVMGGIQSLSRATYSKLLLANDSDEDLTSYFSLSDVLYKISIVSGTLIFGAVLQLTGNMRYAVLTLSLLFLSSLIFILKINVPKSEQTKLTIK